MIGALLGYFFGLAAGIPSIDDEEESGGTFSNFYFPNISRAEEKRREVERRKREKREYREKIKREPPVESIQNAAPCITHKLSGVLVDETVPFFKAVNSMGFCGRAADFTSQNFAKRNKKFCKRNGRKVLKEISIFHFNKPTSFKSIVEGMKRSGYRPAGVWDLLGIFVAKPDLQEKFGIYALNSVCRTWDGYRCIANLDDERSIGMHLSDFNFESECRFAGIRVE